MTTTRLTDAVVRDLIPPKTGMAITWDSEVKGFGARITKAGARSFVVGYRAGGVQRQPTIGSFPDWRTTAAREEAKRLKREVDVGGDPMAERTAERRAATIADLAAFYTKKHLPTKRESSQQNDPLIIAKHILPHLKAKKVVALTHADIAKWHSEISTGKGIAANRAMSLLSKMMSLAVQQEWRADNPCAGVAKNSENRREVYLSEEQIAALWSALDDRNLSSARAIRLLLLTGARRQEVLGSTWEQYDLDAATWTKPASTTKQAKLHRVPLSDDAVALLQAMKAEADQAVIDAKKHGRIMPKPHWLFPSRGGKIAQASLRKVWASACKDAGLSDVHIHDLRHTHASILVSRGQSLETIGAVLGHSNPATTFRYAHLADKPIRHAVNVVADVVRNAKPKVVAIKPAKPPGKAVRGA